MIACLGETTGDLSLSKNLELMKASEEGQQILKDKPRINTTTVDLAALRALPDSSFGHTYVKFLDDNVSKDSN